MRKGRENGASRGPEAGKPRECTVMVSDGGPWEGSIRGSHSKAREVGRDQRSQKALNAELK